MDPLIEGDRLALGFEVRLHGVLRRQLLLLCALRQLVLVRRLAVRLLPLGAIELVRVGREGRHVRVALLPRVASRRLAGQVASSVASRAAA